MTTEKTPEALVRDLTSGVFGLYFKTLIIQQTTRERRQNTVPFL